MRGATGSWPRSPRRTSSRLPPVPTASAAHMELVERDTELALLRSGMDRAVSERSGSVVLVAGEAGIGKTALVRSFLDGHRGRGPGARARRRL